MCGIKKALGKKRLIGGWPKPKARAIPLIEL